MLSILFRMREEEEWKTAFSTPTGHFEYLVKPIFSLSRAPGPAVFQALISDILRDMINKFVFVNLDDIPVEGIGPGSGKSCL